MHSFFHAILIVFSNHLVIIFKTMPDMPILNSVIMTLTTG